MLYAHIGKPGQGKTYACVETIYEKQQINLHNIKKNVETYFENKLILLDRGYNLDLNKEFTFKREVKIDKEDVLVDFTFSLNEFLQFEDEEQFETYFILYLLYNDFITHINTTHNINLSKLLPVHQQYTDINGLNIEGVLVSPIDWRDTPRGSIIYYDEIRRKPPYNFTTKTPSTNPIILDMSEVRHDDKDVHLISQDAEDINISLRQLIDKLYFYKRPPQNINACSVYTFDQWLARPRAAADSKRDPKKYVDYRLVTYKKKIYRMYKSASSHTSMKMKISWRVFFYIFLFLLIFSLVAIGLFKIPIFQYFGSAISQMSGGQENSLSQLSGAASSDTSAQKPNQATASNTALNLDIECRKGVNVEKPECVEWFNNLSKNKGSVSGSNSKDIQVSYDPNKPFENKHIQNNISYEVTAKPIFSGCMKKGSKYVAYTQQGTILNEVSQADCDRLIKNNDRPFNYFASQEKVSNDAQNFNQINNQNAIQQNTQRSIQKEEIANNYVDQHLQAKTTNGANAL